MKKLHFNEIGFWPPVEVVTFNIYREDDCEYSDRELGPPVDGITTELLDKSHVDELLNLPHRINPESVILARFDRGDLCLGVRNREGRLIGFCWTFFHWLYFGTYRMPLLDDETSLFDVYVVPDYRGRGLAGYIRCTLVELLKERGIKKFYSACLKNNHAAIRFRDKLGVRKVDEGFTIKFFNRWRIGTKARPEKVRA